LGSSFLNIADGEEEEVEIVKGEDPKDEDLDVEDADR
jgi:hypothetical protein